jgi:hypothetical protein
VTDDANLARIRELLKLNAALRRELSEKDARNRNLMRAIEKLESRLNRTHKK